MTIGRELTIVLDKLDMDWDKQTLPPETIISLLDLTLLDEQASPDQLAKIAYNIARYPVAAVCLFPQQLTTIHIPQGIKRAAVVNFPEGNQPGNQVVRDIEQAITMYHANEIDYVFPYQAYLQGDKISALAHCREACRLCFDHQTVIKVILETGAFSSYDVLYQLGRDILEQGSQFLKTSTGKIAKGATPEATLVLLKAIKDSGRSDCGIKISGGIKTAEQAAYYINLAESCIGRQVDSNWFRIGASSLLDDLISNCRLDCP